jgi:hypothetical protein
VAVLCSQRFADLPPAQVYATLLDEGVYECSIRQMYRLLHAAGWSASAGACWIPRTPWSALMRREVLERDH